MSTAAYEEMRKVSLEHLENPEPGDYWHEMFCPVLVVLHVVGQHVLYCEKRKDTTKDRWTWDLTEVKHITKGDLKKRLTYGGSSSVKDLPWCDCSPGAHIEHAEYWRTHEDVG